jgi:hypothetical protein
VSARSATTTSPRRSPWRRTAAALLLLATSAARAEQPPSGDVAGPPASAPAPARTEGQDTGDAARDAAIASAEVPVRSSRYRLTARIVLSPRALATEYEHDPLGGPPNPRGTVSVGVQAGEAWSAAVQRLFGGGAPGTPALAVEISIAEARIEAIAGWWRVRVIHDVLLRAEPGEVVARWRAEGENRLDGLGPRSIPLAFARAAEKAASSLEREMDRSAEVRAWLAQHGIPRRVLAPPIERPRPALADRGRFVAFVDVGAGGDWWVDGSALGIGARAGASGGWLLVQAAIDAWRAPFAPRPVFGTATDARVDFLVAGADVGGVRRLGRSFEIRAGAGVRLVAARARIAYELPDRLDGEMTIAKSRTAGTLFGSLVYSPPTIRRAFRGRMGVDVRRQLGGGAWVNAFGREVAPGTTILLFLGAELPIGGARPVASGR